MKFTKKNPVNKSCNFNQIFPGFLNWKFSVKWKSIGKKLPKLQECAIKKFKPFTDSTVNAFTCRACVRVRCKAGRNTSIQCALRWAFAAFWSGESFWIGLLRLPAPVRYWARCLGRTTTNTWWHLGARVVATIESPSCNLVVTLHPSSRRFAPFSTQRRHH